MFWDGDPATLDGKTRAAFRSGFLGLASFGWSTLVEVAQATEQQVEAAVETLARHLIEAHGAPDLAAARAAACEEIELSASLADHPLGTVIALQRAVDPDGSVRERLMSLCHDQFGTTTVSCRAHSISVSSTIVRPSPSTAK